MTQLGKKAMTNLDSVLKSKDITLPTKVCRVKAMGFLVVKYRCENWTIKKAEPEELMLFELWCWRRLLRVPCTARRSNQSILKETSPEYSLEGLTLKLKHQWFGHLMWRTDSLEKTQILGKTESRRRKRLQRMRWLVSTTDSMYMNLSKPNRWGNSGNSVRLYFLGHHHTADGDCSCEIKTFIPWKESYDQPR